MLKDLIMGITYMNIKYTKIILGIDNKLITLYIRYRNIYLLTSFFLIMLIGIAMVKGKAAIVFNDAKKFYYDDLSIYDKCITEKPELFFKYLKTYKSHDLIEINEPENYMPPSPVERVYLPAINFKSHSSESSMTQISSPYFFQKFKTSIVPHKGIAYIPKNVSKFDYEGEIAIVIGGKGKYLSKADAKSVIFGFSIVNDLSIRDYQMVEYPRYGKNWVLGKSEDYGLPYGPFILPIEDAGELYFEIKTYVNNELRQDGNTNDMIFSMDELISEISKITMLRPGDIITTGTPAGVAVHNSKVFLKDGDKVRVNVSKIGTLETLIKNEKSL
jgi:2-keto-4-pentenoate hydratase/2-oxohepta-3-ene-1,7-dioic acid hydratase in catechol pathway